MMSALRLLVVLLCAVSACAHAQTSPQWRGDASFERGAFDRAVIDYERELRERPQAPDRREAQLRLALAYLAHPILAQRQRARPLLEQMANSSPHDATGRQAAILAGHLGELERGAAQLRREQQRLAALEEAVARLRELSLELANRARASEEQRLVSDEERLRLSREVEQLKATVAEQKAHVARVTEQLDRLSEQLDGLKSIDLQRR